jgi:hypothetical protein
MSARKKYLIEEICIHIRDHLKEVEESITWNVMKSEPNTRVFAKLYCEQKFNKTRHRQLLESGIIYIDEYDIYFAIKRIKYEIERLNQCERLVVALYAEEVVSFEKERKRI